MIVGIDHLVIACHDPAAAALDVEREVGLRASGGGMHDALGTHNRIIWLGDAYIELIGVFDTDLAARSWIGGPTLAAVAAGGGLATYALASGDLAGDVGGLRSAGSTISKPVSGQRRRADGRIVRWSLAAPPVLGPAEPPFLIEHDPAAAEWTASDRAARASAAHPVGSQVRLERVELPVPDVHRVAMAYVRTLAIPFRPSLAGGGARDAAVGDQTIRLRRAPIGPVGSPPTWPMVGSPPIAPVGSAPIAPVGSPPTWPMVTIACRVLGGGRAGRTAELLGCRFVLEPAADGERRR